jgi:hypothetical protein
MEVPFMADLNVYKNICSSLKLLNHLKANFAGSE